MTILLWNEEQTIDIYQTLALINGIFIGICVVIFFFTRRAIRGLLLDALPVFPMGGNSQALTDEASLKAAAEEELVRAFSKRETSWGREFRSRYQDSLVVASILIIPAFILVYFEWISTDVFLILYTITIVVTMFFFLFHPRIMPRVRLAFQKILRRDHVESKAA